MSKRKPDIWFTADQHFGHTNIIRFQNRPFRDVQHMNREMISRWNQVVGKQDIVYVLGDFALRIGRSSLTRIFEALNGFKHLVIGGHDKSPVLKLPWESMQWANFLRTDEDEFIHMSHYCHRVWEKSHFNSWHLYGHSHGHLPPIGKSMDVGVDCWDYRPVNLVEVEYYMADRPDNENYLGNRERGKKMSNRKRGKY